MMERTLLTEVPKCLKVLVRQFDLIKLPETRGSTECSKGPLCYLTCGFVGMPDSSLRALVYRPIESEEWLCHVRFTIRPCSSFADLMEFELGYESLSSLLRGTGIRTLDASGVETCTKFMWALDDEFMAAFRGTESVFNAQEEGPRILKLVA